MRISMLDSGHMLDLSGKIQQFCIIDCSSGNIALMLITYTCFSTRQETSDSSLEVWENFYMNFWTCPLQPFFFNLQWKFLIVKSWKEMKLSGFSILDFNWTDFCRNFIEKTGVEHLKRHVLLQVLHSAVSVKPCGRRGEMGGRQSAGLEPYG